MPKPVMMTSISDNGQGTREGELYGIEIEVENVNARLMPPLYNYWLHVEDGWAVHGLEVAHPDAFAVDGQDLHLVKADRIWAVG